MQVKAIVGSLIGGVSAPRSFPTGDIILMIELQNPNIRPWASTVRKMEDQRRAGGGIAPSHC
jgi:hypothetical protein